MQINHLWYNVLVIFCLTILSCSKDDSPEGKLNNDQIKYGNLTGKMVFPRDDNGTHKIVILNFDIKNVTTYATKDNAGIYSGSVSLSPDGSMIAYAASSNGYQIFTLSTLNGNFKQLTGDNSNPNIHNICPIWNANGTKIIYNNSGYIIAGPVYSISPDGQNNLKIADYGVHSRVSISKNGLFLLFGLREHIADNISTGIYSLDIQNKTVNQLVKFESGFYAYGPVYSPDEKRIAYVVRHGINDGGTEPYYFKIMTMNVDGTDQKMVVQLSDNCYWGDVYTAWSPDGTKLAFNLGALNSISFPDWNHIYTINSDGTDLTQITNGDCYDGAPMWIE